MLVFTKIACVSWQSPWHTSVHIQTLYVENHNPCEGFIVTAETKKKILDTMNTLVRLASVEIKSQYNNTTDNISLKPLPPVHSHWQLCLGVLSRYHRIISIDGRFLQLLPTIGLVWMYAGTSTRNHWITSVILLHRWMSLMSVYYPWWWREKASTCVSLKWSINVDISLKICWHRVR